jgi:hypothetical protein
MKRLTPAELSAMHAEYVRLTAERKKWNVLSLAFGGPGLVLSLVFTKFEGHVHPWALGGIAALGIGAFALGLVFGVKYKGRNGNWAWVFPLSIIGLIILATLEDHTKARLDAMKRDLQSNGLTVT